MGRGSSPAAFGLWPSGDRQTLRLAVNSACNLRCAYCLPRKPAVVAERTPLAGDTLAQLATWLANTVPIGAIRITGGEPTLRADLMPLVAQLAQIVPRPELALTTNATRLHALAHRLRRSGLDRVNISLDSVDRLRYHQITGVGRLTQALEGIDAAREAGLSPIKLNAVLRRSCWRDDVPGLLDYAQDHGYQLRFLELMQMGAQSSWCEREFVAASEVIGWLRDACGDVVFQPGGGPARESVVSWRGKPLTVGWITPVSRPFCGGCTRLRLDSRGELRRCLVDKRRYPLVMRLEAADDCAVREEVLAYLAGKGLPAQIRSRTPMAHIGG